MRIRGFIHTQHSVTTLGPRPALRLKSPTIKGEPGAVLQGPAFSSLPYNKRGFDVTSDVIGDVKREIHHADGVKR